MRAPRPAANDNSFSATVLWIMATLGPTPGPFDGMTSAESRLSEHYRRGLAPVRETCRRAYLAARR